MTASPTSDWSARIETAWNTLDVWLRRERTASGHWIGQLSPSALSTATAISALTLTIEAQGRAPDGGSDTAGDARGETESLDPDARRRSREALSAGLRWLARQQNADGGFGDTDRSHSNIATTLLVLAARTLAARATPELVPREDGERDPSLDATAWRYVESRGTWEGLQRRYGRDKTFVVPILCNCALAGLVPWRQVPALPFEAAWLPQRFYRWARMPVVSYAIPALVAIGQVRFHFAPPRNPLLRALRARALAPTLRVLRSMQPASGGYLEATPLTSFVLMALAASGQGHPAVARDCVRFLLDSQLSDGSWPIDTNLATWLTSLTVHGYGRRGGLDGAVDDSAGASPSGPAVAVGTVRWLLDCQHRQRHPFTGADPGGWGWTDLSGAVPDADDTPAALLALRSIDWTSPQWEALRTEAMRAVALGIGWLLRLQNRDGGWPTFCRGWGRLPFDRSGTDLTAHALRALHAWSLERERIVAEGGAMPRPARIQRAIDRGLRFLARTQQPDGSWLPLWFGNQDRSGEDNPPYGTGKVLMAYAALDRRASEAARRGVEYLRSSQNADGGWGGGASVRYGGDAPGAHATIQSTIEETSVALEGLLLCGGQPHGDATIMRGLDWLVNAVRSGRHTRAWPIGFYFAKLWYHERLYPAVFALNALGVALERCPQFHGE